MWGLIIFLSEKYGGIFEQNRVGVDNFSLIESVGLMKGRG